MAANTDDAGGASHTNLTYGGTTCTVISSAVISNTGSVIGYLLNPSSVAAIAEVTWDATPAFKQTIIVASYSGVDQTTPIASTNTTAVSTNIISTVSGSTDGGVGLVFVGTEQDLHVVSTNLRLRVSNVTSTFHGAAFGDRHTSGSTTVSISGASTRNMTWHNFTVQPASTVTAGGAGGPSFTVILQGKDRSYGAGPPMMFDNGIYQPGVV